MRRDCLILLKNLSTKLRAHHVYVDTIKTSCPGPGSALKQTWPNRAATSQFDPKETFMPSATIE
jgi:hypothetical protein